MALRMCWEEASDAVGTSRIWDDRMMDQNYDHYRDSEITAFGETNDFRDFGRDPEGTEAMLSAYFNKPVKLQRISNTTHDGNGQTVWLFEYTPLG